MRGSWVACLSVVVLLSSAFGCGSERPPLAKVKGVVTFAGVPIKDGAIVFEVPGRRSASGKIIDGKIAEVTTYDNGDGVPVGVAGVAVHAFSLERPVPTAEASGSSDHDGGHGKNYMDVSESVIPVQFNNPATSGLTVKIEPEDNDIVLDLQEP